MQIYKPTPGGTQPRHDIVASSKTLKSHHHRLPDNLLWRIDNSIGMALLKKTFIQKLPVLTPPLARFWPIPRLGACRTRRTRPSLPSMPNTDLKGQFYGRMLLNECDVLHDIFDIAPRRRISLVNRTPALCRAAAFPDACAKEGCARLTGSSTPGRSQYTVVVMLNKSETLAWGI